MSLSLNFTLESSLHKDVTEDILVFADPPTPFNHSCEFEEHEEYEMSVSLMSILTLMNQKIFVYQSHMRAWLCPLIWNLMMIIFLWNMSTNINKSLNVYFCVEYESFTFDLLVTYPLAIQV